MILSVRGKKLIELLIPILALAALIWLGYEFWRLLFQPYPPGAYDLVFRYREVQAWFAGIPVYSEFGGTGYPPATYTLLWPFLGWLELTEVRWVWAALMVGSLFWLIRLMIEESGAESLTEKIFISLVPLSTYATGAAIGNGQLIVFLLPALLTGLLTLYRRERSWGRDLMGAALVLISLAKPTISVPFLWLVFFLPARRSFLLVLGSYVGLTLLALTFQESSAEWLFREMTGNAVEVAAHKGYADLHLLLIMLGLRDWILPASFVVWVGFGVWVYRHRHVDPWLLLGATAWVARFWTYHLWFDDLLILVPMIALYRFAKQSAPDESKGKIAWILFFLTLLSMLAPGGLYLFPEPFRTSYLVVQVAIWAAGFVFLLSQARRLA